MIKKFRKKINLIKSALIILYIFLTFVISPLPAFNKLFPEIKIAPNVEAGTGVNGFRMQTGYYIGNGGGQSITGVGFSPDLVIINPDTAASAIWRSKVMPQNTSQYFVATAESTAGLLNLDADGFTVTGAGNTANTRFTWVAFAGSDCTSAGVFCVGRYTGTGSGTQAVTSVGFQPDLVVVKQTTAVNGNWKSSASGMAATTGQYFANVTQDTTGILFQSLDATGFTSGTTNNASGNFYYFAFKNVSGAMKVGTHTGTAGDNLNVTGVGFQPNFVFLKNANAGTAQYAYMSQDESYGDQAGQFAAATAVGTDIIQGFHSDGFQVGTNAASNGSGNTIYYAAFGGSENLSAGSGTFKSVSGSYTGSGENRMISNLDFKPDLVIIKGGANLGVFRTSLMAGDSTAYLASATANTTNMITSINPDGFSLGTNATVNAAATVYYWTAYGNAWNSVTNSGSSDFYIGSYTGNLIDNRNITRLPFQADLVTVKALTGSLIGFFKTSAMGSSATDLTGFLSAAAETTNYIQALQSDGFQIGNIAAANTANTVYYYFGFKSGSNFGVGTYQGNGSTQSINVGFQPNAIWSKIITNAQAAAYRTSEGAADSALPLSASGSVTGAITSITATGFNLGSNALTNTSGTNNYRYVVWKNTNSVGTPTFKMQTGSYTGNGNAETISGLGFTPQFILIKSATSAASARWRSAIMPANVTGYLAAATADDTGYLITANSDGFTVIGVLSTVNVRFTWIAVGGSDCSASGYFCLGWYSGSGATKAITSVGFQPDLVFVKSNTTANDGNWRSSSMSNNHAQFFSITAANTAGGFFTTLDATGFTVGASNSTTSVGHTFVAFKQLTSKIKVGTYTAAGTPVDNTNITGVGFQPDFVWIKSVSTAVAQFTTGANPTDSSSVFGAAGSQADVIQQLISDGFQIGTSGTVNTASTVHYYFALGDSNDVSSGSGSFEMAKGTYTGSGIFRIIKGINFVPDLIIIKGDTTTETMFRTSEMSGNSTNYLGASANPTSVTDAIVSINNDGFSLGNSTIVNNSGVTYYWTAFGNAWSPETNSGSSDFYITTTYGTGVDNTSIGRLPFQADLLHMKSNNNSVAGVFRTTPMTSGNSVVFTAAAETTGSIKSMNSSGFILGTDTKANASGILFWVFGFKEGANFDVGSYTGNGTSQTVTSGFQPDYIWVKSATSAGTAVQRTSDGATNSALPVPNTANVNNAITSITSSGFTVGSAAQANTSTVTYRHAAWKGAGITVDGTCRYPDTITFCTNGTVVKVAVNGTLQPETGEVYAGSFNIYGVPIVSGDVVTVFLDDVSDANEGAVVTAYDGTGNITAQIRQQSLKLGTSDNATITNADIALYDNSASGDEDIFYEVDSNNDLFADYTNQFDEEFLLIPSGNTYRPDSTSSGNVTTHSIQFGGTFTADGNQIFVSGNWTITGTFNAGSSTVNLNGTYAKDGLIAYLNLNENTGTSAADLSGNGNTGALTNGPTWTTGISSSALDFDGSDDVVDMGSASIIDDLGPVTFDMWFYADGLGEGGLGRLFEKQSSTTANGYRLQMNTNNSLIFAVDYGTTDIERKTVDSSFSLSTWNHVVVTWDGSATASNVKIYINNTEASYATAVDGVGARQLDNGQNLRIGNTSDGSRTFDGKIDEFKVYNKVRAPFTSGGGTSPTIYWNMNENTGSTAVDSGTAGVNLSLTNTSWTTGKYGASGLDYNGTTAYSRAADNAVFTQANITWEAWFNMDQTASSKGSEQYILEHDHSAAPYRSYDLFVDPGSNQLTSTVHNQAGSGVFLQGGGALSASTWYHAAFTYDGTTARLYLNGSQVASSALSGTGVLNADGYMTVGAGDDGQFGTKLDGKIDDVRMYTTARTAGEISADMASEYAPATPTPVLSQTLSGATTFYNLTANTLAEDRIIYFDNTATTRVTNNITLQGNACSSQLYLFSVSSGNQWSFDDDSGGTTLITNVNVKDSNAIDQSITATGTNSGNNTSWSISACVSNVAPNAPTSLAQKTTGDVTITTGNWHNSTSVKFTATATDTDNPDTLQLCIEADFVGTTFSNTEDSCGSGVSYSGSGVTVSHTLTVTDANVYHWQARIKDAGGLYSTWVTFTDATTTAPVGYWKFNEGTGTSAADSGSGGNAGTLTNGPTWAGGKYSDAVNFDGNDDVVNMGASSTLAPAILTVTAWIYVSSTSATGGNVVSKGDNSGYRMRYLTDRSLHFLDRGATNNLSSAAGVFSYDTWTHVAFVGDASGLKIYVNGSLIASNATAFGAPNSGNFVVGSRNAAGTGGETFKGMIDEVKVYNYARSVTQLSEDAISGGDFGIDTTAPTSGTIYDGNNNGVDITFNDGSLSQLYANWNSFNGNVSGIVDYEYSVGTTAGGTSIKGWTSNGNNRSATITGMSLQSSQLYYVNIRATDAAGNVMSSFPSSNGQFVAPTLAFSLSSNNITFDNLNPGNSFTDTETTTITTSTNAYNGYIIKVYKTGLLTASNGSTIGDFNGGTYASPSAFTTSFTGFGYTSSDTLVQGVNKFNPTLCNNGAAPCYVPFSSSAPGDIAADNPGTISGSPITNEQFTITYKIRTDTTQAAGDYTTNLIYSVIPTY